MVKPIQEGLRLAIKINRVLHRRSKKSCVRRLVESTYHRLAPVVKLVTVVAKLRVREDGFLRVPQSIVDLADPSLSEVRTIDCFSVIVGNA